MSTCPFCDSENIEGADECDACGLPLDDMHLTPPTTEVERSLLRDRVSVLVPRPVLKVPPTMPVGQVLGLLADNEVGCAVVAHGNRPVGIFSERDALNKLNADAAALAAHPVSEYMTPNPITLVASAKVAYAVERMHVQGCRHLPIVDGAGELVGIISARDILRYLKTRLSRDAAE